MSRSLLVHHHHPPPDKEVLLQIATIFGLRNTTLWYLSIPSPPPPVHIHCGNFRLHVSAKLIPSLFPTSSCNMLSSSSSGRRKVNSFTFLCYISIQFSSVQVTTSPRIIIRFTFSFVGRSVAVLRGNWEKFWADDQQQPFIVNVFLFIGHSPRPAMRGD